MNINKIILAFMLVGLTNSLFSQIPPSPKDYVCYRLADNLTIDGKLDEKSWKLAPWSEPFEDIEGPEKPTPAEQTHFKMLWDDSMLYVGAHIETKNIWATLTQHDAIIYHDNDFEVFISPNNDNYHYGEMEFNALGTLMDIMLDRPYRDGGLPIFDWECKGIRCAVSYQGTINDPTDIDTAWDIEIAIPLQSILDLKRGKKDISENSQWRINFSRVQWDLKVENNMYEKLQQPEHNWVWSPQWAINMHRPEYWGYLQFSLKKVGTDPDTFIPDPHWDAKMQLMAVYYAEKQYYMQQHLFTEHFSNLSIPAYVDMDKLSIRSDGDQFIVKTIDSGDTLFVDHGGRLGTE